MSEIAYTYQRTLKEFGRPPEFQSTGEPEVLVDFLPSEELKKLHERVNPHETEIQNVPQLSEAQTNTDRINQKNQGQNHHEGGWPIGIDPTEFEEKMKHCKKAERDESYYGSVKNLVERGMEKYIKQNNAVDIYGTYFGGPPAGEKEEPSALTSAGPPSIKTMTVFKDPSPVKRTAVKMSWLSDGKKLAVAYCNLRFQAAMEGMSTASHIWDVQNPNEPIETLVPQSPLTTIEYYGKDPHLIAGGSYNGVVQYWDTRQPKRPVAKSAVEDSHKDAVWDLKWLQSKSGEILSVSTDGQCFIWDCRKQEKPVEQMVLKKFENESLMLKPSKNENGPSGVLGGTCIDYDAMVGGPTKFMIGTEQGTILNCNKKQKGQDKIGQMTFNGHHGPVYTVQRNPAHSKYFLTVGDWTARLWVEDKATCIFSTFYHKCHLTNACWHPQRAGVFFTTRMDGCVDVWDLMTRQSSPVLSVHVSDFALHTIKPTPEGHHVAVGGVDGTTTLLEVSPSLHTPTANEKVSIGKMLDNEAARDKLVLANIKAKTLAREKAKKAAQNRSNEPAVDKSKEDEELQSAAENFLKAVEADTKQQDEELDALEQKRAGLRTELEGGWEPSADQ